MSLFQVSKECKLQTAAEVSARPLDVSLCHLLRHGECFIIPMLWKRDQFAYINDTLRINMQYTSCSCISLQINEISATIVGHD